MVEGAAFVKASDWQEDQAPGRGSRVGQSMIGYGRWLWRRLSLLFYREEQVKMSTVRKNQPCNAKYSLSILNN